MVKFTSIKVSNAWEIQDLYLPTFEDKELKKTQNRQVSYSEYANKYGYKAIERELTNQGELTKIIKGPDNNNYCVPVDLEFHDVFKRLKPIYGYLDDVDGSVRETLMNFILKGYSLNEISLIEGMPEASQLIALIYTDTEFQELLTLNKKLIPATHPAKFKNKK